MSMPSSQPLRLLVFDSGVGGLTVFDPLAQRIPDADYLYVADNAFAPYGTKSPRELSTRLKQLIPLFQAWDPDLVVVACNSASTHLLPKMRQHLSMPIVGVVPPLKPAGFQARGETVGLLATALTTEGSYVQQLWQSFGGGGRLIKCPANELVALAEAKLRGEAPPHSHRFECLAPLRQQANLHHVVLGCTHFPHLLEELRTQLPQVRHWYDPGPAVAARVLQVLEQACRLDGTGATPSTGTRRLFTSAPAQTAPLWPAYQARGFVYAESSAELLESSIR